MTDVVYKYRSMAKAKDVSYTLDILDRHRLYCAAPSSFNDPFECRCTLVFDAPIDVKNTRAVEHLRGERSDLSPEQLASLAHRRWQQLENRDPSEFRRQLQEDTGIVSFGVRPDVSLMWSHYAGSHNGICLEFRASAEHHAEFFAQVLKVHYSSDFPVVNFYTDSPLQRLHAYVLTKARHWSHEQEWRLVLHEPPSDRFVPIPRGLLTAVFLGARISTTNRNLVLSRLVAPAASGAIRVYQAALAPNAYQLRFATVVPSISPAGGV